MGNHRKDYSSYLLTISFSNYKSRAKSKNWEFSLTKEEFSGLSLSNCHYCNQEPPKS